jgi:hypothetical protein
MATNQPKALAKLLYPNIFPMVTVPLARKFGVITDTVLSPEARKPPLTPTMVKECSNFLQNSTICCT